MLHCLRVCVCVRVSYIFCDPVLACITVIPVLLLHRLPMLIEAYLCVERATTRDEFCMNHSSSVLSDGLQGVEGNLTRQQKETLYDSVVSLPHLCSVAFVACCCVSK